MASALEIGQPQVRELKKGDTLRFYPLIIPGEHNEHALSHYTAVVLNGKIADCMFSTTPQLEVRYDTMEEWIASLPLQNGTLYINDRSPEENHAIEQKAREKVMRRLTIARLKEQERVEKFNEKEARRKLKVQQTINLLSEQLDTVELKHRWAVQRQNPAVIEIAAPMLQPRGRVRDFAPVYDKE